MTQRDRDNMFSLMVFFSKLDEWQKDTETELTEKDKKKLKVINDTIIALLMQYSKREGSTALETMFEESRNFNFAILDKNQEFEVSGTFEPTIIKGAIKKLLQNNAECLFCEKQNYKDCELFTLNNFIGKDKCDCNGCPYKNNFIKDLLKD